MKIKTLVIRNFKEIIRDPLSIIFAILLPLFLLFIFQQFEIPSEVYSIENFTPGIIIFSFSFITLFTANLVASDRSTSFLIRLGVSPLKSSDFIFGYTLSIIPIILIQNILFYLLAFLLGLSFSINIIYAILLSIPLSILFIMLGILIGSLTSVKSSSGISSIIVQLVAFTSGMYFSTDMVGGFFASLCKALPFSHELNILKTILNGWDISILSDIIIVLIYTIIITFVSIIIFKKKATDDGK